MIDGLLDWLTERILRFVDVSEGTARLGAWVILLALGFVVISTLWGKLEQLLKARRGGGGRVRTAKARARHAARAGEFGAAAQILEDAGDPKGARTYHEQAARAAERARDWMRAAAHHEKLGEFTKAGRLYFRMGEWDAAVRAFTDAGDDADVARSLQHGGHLDEAARIYTSLGRGEDAMRCLQAATAPDAHPDLRERRVELAEQGVALARELGRSRALADFLEAAGKPELAAAEHVKAGNHARAAYLLEEAGRWADAARQYQAAGDRDGFLRCSAHDPDATGSRFLAGRALEASGRWEEAAEAHEKAGDRHGYLRCSGRAALERGDPREAARRFEEAGDWIEAAAAFVALGEPVEAARCLSRAGDHVRAAELLERAGDRLAAAASRLAAGQAFAAGVLLHEAGRTDDALEAFRKVSQDSDDFLEARAMAGLIRFQNGERAAARALLEQVVPDLEARERPSQRLVDYLHALADCQSADEDITDALGTLRRAALIDPEHADVTGKIAALDRRHRDETLAVPVGERRQEAPMAAPPRYRLMRELGRGGMGSVHLATDQLLDRLVALKMLSAEWREHHGLRSRFLNEARVAARLVHPNVVSVFDVGEHEGRPYMALEYVDGKDLESLLGKTGRLPEAQAVKVIAGVARALQAAHDAGVVHRDIKPANVFLGNDGSVKVGDFGIARTDGADLTETGMVVGTPRYMSPEQITGKKVDFRSDLYSLGITAYRILTGQVPFPKGDVAYQHVHAQPENPRTLVPDLSPALVELVLRCLAKNPAARPESAAAVADALDALTAGASA